MRLEPIQIDASVPNFRRTDGERLDAQRAGAPRIQPIEVKIRRSDWSGSAVLGERGAAARDFADIVAARLVGTVLPWSDRQALIRTASDHGITRFEANLIIAAVQHQMGIGLRRRELRRTPLAKIAAGFAVFFVVQAGIIAAAWYWLF